MRKTIVATAAAVLMSAGTLGCKSAPKLAFWKSAEKSDVESTALAHSAPALPADVAKQAESLATTSPSIEMSAPGMSASGMSTSGMSMPAGQAPPYSPSLGVASTAAPSLGSGSKMTPSSYPTTSAPAYPATTSNNTLASTTGVPQSSAPASNLPTDRSADLGSIDMPYNPNAVPPAKNIAATTPTTPSTGTDRYGMSSVASTPPAYGSGTSSAPVSSTASQAVGGAGTRYGGIPSMPQTPALPGSTKANLASTATPGTASTPSAYPSTSVGLAGDRYASASSTTPPDVPSVPPAQPMTTTPTESLPAVVSIPFRPGGTGTYQGSSADRSAVEIATRPASADQEVPNVAAPGAEPTTAPRYR